MRTSNEITRDLGVLYHPISALVFYQSKEENTKKNYVEHFEMDGNGNPINAHPLTVEEANKLAESLCTEEERNKAFLKSKGILPVNILHINPSKGTVLWYTKAQKRQLYFVENLGIPSGKAYVPPMLWYADKETLSVFAVASGKRPTENTPLHYAPFYNIYEGGNVCMGTVTIDIKNSVSLDEFTTAWETYFFNSYFSHLMGYNPTRGYCDSLWKHLIKTGETFPKERLKKNNRTLKNLLR